MRHLWLCGLANEYPNPDADLDSFADRGDPDGDEYSDLDADLISDGHANGDASPAGTMVAEGREELYPGVLCGLPGPVQAAGDLRMGRGLADVADMVRRLPRGVLGPDLHVQRKRVLAVLPGRRGGEVGRARRHMVALVALLV